MSTKRSTTVPPDISLSKGKESKVIGTPEPDYIIASHMLAWCVYVVYLGLGGQC